MITYRPFGPNSARVPDTLASLIEYIRDLAGQVTRQLQAIGQAFGTAARAEYYRVDLPDATSLTIRHGLKEVPRAVSLVPIGAGYIYLASEPTAEQIVIAMDGNGGDPRSVLVGVFA